MKIQTLLDQLNKLVTQNPRAAEATVVFGPEEGENVPIEGGLYGVNHNRAEPDQLVLAPIKLDNVGGF